MKVFVIGATGRTGSEVVEQALARGHQVTAFVRSHESLKLKSERLTVINGDVMDENQLANAMQNHDAVASALGPREVFKPSSRPRQKIAMTAMEAANAGTLLKARSMISRSSGTCCPAITSRLTANAKVAATNDSRRVISRPRRRTPPRRGKASRSFGIAVEISSSRSVIYA